MIGLNYALADGLDGCQTYQLAIDSYCEYNQKCGRLFVAADWEPCYKIH